MERIPYPPPEAFPPGLPSANMLRMWANSPATLRPGLALGAACISSLSIPVLLREMLALFLSRKFKCEYMWVRHINDAKKAGITEDKLQALRVGDMHNREVWEEKEIAFFTFLDEVAESPEASDETFQEVQKWFDNRQIVEILTAQGFYYMWARICTTLRVEIDEEVKGDYEKAKEWAGENKQSQ